MNTDFYVYLHRKATTGEVFYVGKGHGNRAWVTTGRSKHWKNIESKHGITVEIAESGLQEWYAFELESELISLYGRKDKKQGNLINLTDGGEGVSGRLLTGESRAKLSRTLKKKFSTPEYRTAASARGIKLLRGTKLRAGLTVKQRDLFGLKVTCVETGDRFVSLTEAVEWLKSKGHQKAIGSHIASAARGNKRLKAYGYSWRISSERSPARISHIRSKAVVSDTLDTIFVSMRQAKDFLICSGVEKASASAICVCCKEQVNSAYGHTWRYATTTETLALKEKGASWAPLSELVA